MERWDDRIRRRAGFDSELSLIHYVMAAGRRIDEWCQLDRCELVLMSFDGNITYRAAAYDPVVCCVPACHVARLGCPRRYVGRHGRGRERPFVLLIGIVLNGRRDVCVVAKIEKYEPIALPTPGLRAPLRREGRIDCLHSFHR